MNKPHENVASRFTKRQLVIGTTAFVVAPLVYGLSDAEARPHHTTAAKMQRMVVRAELKWVMHNEVQASGIKVTCKLISAWAGHCLMRAYDGNKTVLKIDLLVHRVKKHEEMSFEDYSAWKFSPSEHITYLIEPTS